MCGPAGVHSRIMRSVHAIVDIAPFLLDHLMSSNVMTCKTQFALLSGIPGSSEISFTIRSVMFSLLSEQAVEQTASRAPQRSCNVTVMWADHPYPATHSMNVISGHCLKTLYTDTATVSAHYPLTIYNLYLISQYMQTDARGAPFSKILAFKFQSYIHYIKIWCKPVYVISNHQSRVIVKRLITLIYNSPTHIIKEHAHRHPYFQ